jgi:serine/threonine-protein kinase
MATTEDADLSTMDTLSSAGGDLVIGTPFYMSPEQARGQEVDQRSDLFAFGVMLFEMVTGERPFKGANSVELLSAVLKDEPPSVTEVRPELPRHLARVIRRCLEKDPNNRYQTARDVLNELRALHLEVTSGFDRSPVSGLSGIGWRSRRPAVWKKAAWFTVPVVAAIAAAVVFLIGPFGGESPQDADSGRRVVAVLPFENLGSEDDEYFADGITDEITSRLAVINGLAVISRTSARLYKGTNQPATEIGQELGANYILEGTIRWDRSGEPNRVRITPRLIQVTDDTQLWSDTYEHEIMQIFSVQTEIAERIAEALDVTLLADERRALTSQPTDDIEAYQAYLRGMKQLVSPGFGRDAFELGVRMFERAVDLDPGFALAYARLSSMHSRIYHYGFDRTSDRLEKARITGRRALELEPDLAEAHLAIGQYHYWCERDYAAALESLDRAGELAPANSEVWLTKAYVKRRQGDFESAIELFERDFELSPLDPNATIGLGETLGTLRRYAEAERAFKRGIALAPEDPYPYTELALLYLRWRGDSAAARSVLDEMPPVDSTEGCRVAFLAELLDRRFDEALDRLESCPQPVLQAGIFSIPTALFEGMTLELMGEPQAALAAYERSQAILEERLAADDLDHRTHSALGLTYAGLGRSDDAVRHGLRAVELYPVSKDALEAPGLIIDLALIYTMVGDEEAALEELERVLSIQSIFSASWLEADPLWDPLRDNPEFADLLARHAVDTGD